MRSNFLVLSAVVSLGLAHLAQGQSPTAGAPKCVARTPTDTAPTATADSSVHARWSREIRVAIKRHQICLGMSSDMAQQAWGMAPRMRMIIPPVAGDMTVELLYSDETVILVGDSVRTIRPSKRSGKR